MSMDAMGGGLRKGQVCVFAALALSILLFWPGAVSLAALWTDSRGETYTSGFLIAAISRRWSRAAPSGSTSITATRS